MKNVTITGGYSYAEAIAAGSQPYTLARGGGLAVWGTAHARSRARSPGTPAPATSGRAGTAAPTAAASTPTASTSPTASSAATRSSATGRRAAASTRSAAPTTRTAQGTTPTSTGAPSPATGVTGEHCLRRRHLHPVRRAEQPGDDVPDQLHDRPEPGRGPPGHPQDRTVLRPRRRHLHGRRLALPVELHRRENAVTGQPATFSGKPNMGGGGVGGHHRQRPHRRDRLAPELDRRRQHAERRGRGLVRRLHPRSSTARATTSSATSTSAGSSSRSPTG